MTNRLKVSMDIRIIRNKKFKEVEDFCGCAYKFNSLTEDDKQGMDTYRKDLRDVPQLQFPLIEDLTVESIVWPEIPAVMTVDSNLWPITTELIV